jgi:hypothetical protein
MNHEREALGYAGGREQPSSRNAEVDLATVAGTRVVDDTSRALFSRFVFGWLRRCGRRSVGPFRPGFCRRCA